MEKVLSFFDISTLCKHRRYFRYKILDKRIDKTNKFTRLLLKCTRCRKIYKYYSKEEIKPTITVNV